LFDKGKQKESQRYFQKSLEFSEALVTKDSPAWFVTKANMLQAMHQYSESTAMYKEAVSRLKPVDVATKAELLWHIGTNEELQGKFDSAALVYDDSQKLYSKAFGPTSIQATGMLLNMARTKRQLGKLGEAERLLLQARKSLTLPVQKIMLCQCLSELAVVYEQQGDTTKKKQLLQEIAKLN